MKTKLKRFGVGLMALALAFAGAGAVQAETVAMIGETSYETLAKAFEAANNGETVVILNGEHDCTADTAFAKLGTKTVILKGESQAGTVLNMGRGNKTGVQTTPGTRLTLEDMTLKFDHSGSGSPMYDHTFYHPASQTFRNVTIVGQIDIMDDTLFDTCTFTGKVNDKDEYLLWCYGCEAELVNCKFTGSGTKAPIKLFNEGAQCGLKVSETSFAKVGSYDCAVYSSNKYPNNNVYEITVGENVTVPEESEKGLIRSSDVGLTVINPTKDANGKYTGGTFESEKATDIAAVAGKYAAEGFIPAVDPETGKIIVKPDPITGSGTADDPFAIADLEGFKVFRDRVDAGNTYGGKYFVLTADIDLGGENWNPIGDQGHQFAGSFDGRGHTISNLFIDGGCDKLHGVKVDTGKNVGLFAATGSGSSIKNLKIHNVELKGLSTCAGALVGGEYEIEATISNVSITGLIKIGDAVNEYTDDSAANYVGGIIGRGYSRITDCSVIGDDGSFIKSSNYYVGGIAGFIGEDYGKVISNCKVENVHIAGWAPVGGVCGIIEYGNTIENCTVAANVTVENYANIETAGRYFEINGMGGIAGITESGNDVTITGNTFAGKLVRDGVLLFPDDECLHNRGLVGVDRSAKSAATINQANLKMSNNISSYIIPVAQIGETKFATLAEALAAVKDGETVKVLKSGNVVTEYAKQIGEDGYSETNGANRLVFGTDATFVLDLNVNTLSGRINFTKGDMTVSNGTLKATSQVLNVFGRKTVSSAEEAVEPYTTLTIAADCSVEGGNFGVAVFGGDQGNIYWPLGFGETVNIYGKIKALYSPIQTSGNVGMDTYVANIGKNAEVEAVTNALKMGVSAMMAKYGSVVNIYDGAVLETVPGKTEDSSQGISSQGMATYNIYGGKISGAEAIGVKGGIVNVMGGEITAFGVKANPIEAVNSGTEVSGGGIAISTSYNGNYPIVVNVTGGTVKSANNAAFLFEHSWTFDKEKKPVAPCPVVQGVRFAVSGGTFIGAKDEPAIKVEDAIEADAPAYPANFITAQMGADGKTETGYPLCNSSIAAAYIAPGYVEKDNKDGTWTVTAGSREIKTDTEHATVEVTIAEGKEIDPEEAEQAAKEVKENIAEAMKDPEVAEVSGTGIKEAAYETDQQTGEQVLKPVVVAELQKQAVEDFKAANPGATEDAVEAYENAVKEAITKKSKAETTVEVKLDEVKVSVDLSEAEGQTLETTLTSAKFDVKPIFKTTVTIDGKTTVTETTLPPGTETSPITFPLWLNSDFIGQVVMVKHEHEGDVIGTTKEVVKISEGGRKYVEQTWSKFSIALVEAMDITGMACWANNEVYDKVADALDAGLPDDAEIFLLADCAETGLALGVNRKIILNDHAFTGSVAAGDGNEMVRGADGTIYIAPAAVDVPVGGGKYVKVRGYTAFPAGVEKGEYLAGKPEGASLARWQTFVMGVSETTKLVPQIVGATTEGISTVVIKADFPALNPPAKCGVKTHFRLMQAIGTPTGYSQYGVDSNVPHFQVDVKEIAEKTFWKIQTSFKSTEVEEAEVED